MHCVHFEEKKFHDRMPRKKGSIKVAFAQWTKLNNLIPTITNFCPSTWKNITLISLIKFEKQSTHIVVFTLGALVNLILDYKRPWILCLALQLGQKSDMILPFEVVLKLKLPRNHFNKKCAPKILFLIEKKNQKDSDDFWHRKFTFKVQFSHFAPSWQS